mmetsp:Transcript_34148/g.82187  ORF Transcript_34148/g.82187 Transcript_34148/m.82187 type:complete len:81 (-) Transcript_34148:37-279(-)
MSYHCRQERKEPVNCLSGNLCIYKIICGLASTGLYQNTEEEKEEEEYNSYSQHKGRQIVTLPVSRAVKNVKPERERERER